MSDARRPNRRRPRRASRTRGALGRASRDDLALRGDALRWCCDPGWLTFETTRTVEPARGIVGQDEAIASLRFGLEFRGAGQNVYVRGLAGTGRTSSSRIGRG